MDFSVPESISKDVDDFKSFLSLHLKPQLSSWYKSGVLPLDFFHRMASGGWLGIQWQNGKLEKTSALREAMLQEELAKESAGVAVAILAHVNLGFMGLFLFGSDHLKKKYATSAAAGETVMCLGNTENLAGSDVAGIAMQAEQADGGWLLNGTKAYVTNGDIAESGGYHGRVRSRCGPQPPNIDVPGRFERPGRQTQKTQQTGVDSIRPHAASIHQCFRTRRPPVG